LAVAPGAVDDPASVWKSVPAWPATMPPGSKGHLGAARAGAELAAQPPREPELCTWHVVRRVDTIAATVSPSTATLPKAEPPVKLAAKSTTIGPVAPASPWWMCVRRSGSRRLRAV
jgi:hypothetical protein